MSEDSSIGPSVLEQLNKRVDSRETHHFPSKPKQDSFAKATMSGVEVAGLILGAIPLIIEGFKRSQIAFAAFDTYRHYPKELTKLNAKISAQKTVFRNNCINLLSTITNDRPKVDAMLTEISHAAWQDAAMYNTLATQVEALDESFTSCQRTMEQIDNALQSICKETEAFQAILIANSEVRLLPY